MNSKCITKDCPNELGGHSGNAIMIPDPKSGALIMRFVCSSCWWFIVYGHHPESQLYRNAVNTATVMGEVVPIGNLSKALQSGFAEVMNQVEQHRSKAAEFDEVKATVQQRRDDYIREGTVRVTAQQKPIAGECPTR